MPQSFASQTVIVQEMPGNVHRCWAFLHCIRAGDQTRTATSFRQLVSARWRGGRFCNGDQRPHLRCPPRRELDHGDLDTIEGTRAVLRACVKERERMDRGRNAGNLLRRTSAPRLCTELVQRATTVNIDGDSYRLREKRKAGNNAARPSSRRSRCRTGWRFCARSAAWSAIEIKGAHPPGQRFALGAGVPRLPGKFRQEDKHKAPQRLPLRGFALCQSGRPDSNRRRPAWEAGILPTELRPQNQRQISNTNCPLRSTIYVPAIATR